MQQENLHNKEVQIKFKQKITRSFKKKSKQTGERNDRFSMCKTKPCFLGSSTGKVSWNFNNKTNWLIEMFDLWISLL